MTKMFDIYSIIKSCKSGRAYVCEKFWAQLRPGLELTRKQLPFFSVVLSPAVLILLAQTDFYVRMNSQLYSTVVALYTCVPKSQNF